ncbi:MAG TPA: DNA repair protein RadA, partial [Candidatus Ruania gallistercoris]|nr:DNA repair protein RadA [Candidatus Ruania gallistercoris]
VLHGRLGVDTAARDVYVATVGGARVTEPACDLAIALAVVGARRDLTVHHGLIAIGEVGLTGEVRAAIGLPRRLAEAARLGFTRAIVPATGELGTVPESLEVIRVANLHEAVATAERVEKVRNSDPVPLRRV